MHRLRLAARLFISLGADLFRSSFLLAWDVLSPRDYSQVRILAFRMRARSNREIMLLSSAITLTPGTLTLDVSDDRTTIFIHAMYAHDPEAVERHIRDDVETPLLTLMRGSPP